MARSAGLAIADRPGKNSFHPLIIYGDVGLGKTHLAHAIGHRVLELHPEKIVLYVATDKFTQQIIAILKHTRILLSKLLQTQKPIIFTLLLLQN